MIRTSFGDSEPKIIIHKDDMDPVLMAGKSGDKELAADGIRGFAVNAGAGLDTGSGDTDPLGINGGGNTSGPLHG